jgi:hypothetical protein
VIFHLPENGSSLTALPEDSAARHRQPDVSANEHRWITILTHDLQVLIARRP